MARVMAPDGAGLVTAFTYSSVDTPVSARLGWTRPVSLRACGRAWNSGPRISPAWLISLFAEKGLATEFHAGFWRPQEERTLSYQDILVVRRMPPTPPNEAPPVG